MSPKHFLWSCTKFVLCGLTGLMGLLGMCIFTALSLEPLTCGAAAIALLGFGLMITVYAEGIQPGLEAEDRAEASIKIRRE